MDKMIPLFIGGTGRSGTTLLFNYLANSSKVNASNYSEIKILTSVDGLISLHRKKNIDTFNLYIKKIISNKNDPINVFINSMNEGDLIFLLNNLFADFKKNPTQSIRDFYFNIFIKNIKIKEKSIYLIDSTPENIMRSYKIKEIFPEAKFIHVIRDGRDSGYSEYETMKKYKFSSDIKNEFDGLYYWYNRIIKSFESLKNTSKDNYIDLRLESFVSRNTKLEKNKIINFLKIKDEENMNIFFKNNVSLEKMSCGKWKNIKNWKEFDLEYNKMLKNLKNKGIIIEKYY